MKLLSTFIIVFIFSCSHTSEIRKASLISGKKQSQYEARAKNYMISTQGHFTTQAAKYAIDQGGNIFDAATAASFAISVERPHSTGIGGGGFMILNHAKSQNVEAFDFREMAPSRAHSKMFLDKNGKQITEKSLTGPYASGVPGLVAGVLEVQKKYGKLPLSIVMKPAIDLAENGFEIYPALARALEAKSEKLCKFPASKKIFLNDNCSPKKAGERLFQKDLAQTLRIIAKKGREGFYAGEVAQKIVSSQKKYQGLITLSDLKNYQVKMREPVVGTFRGNKVVSMPPPSSGGTHVIQILNILESFPLKELGPQSAEAIHLTASAMQIAFADRAAYLGDSDYADVPIKTLISKKYANALAKKIPRNKALSSKDFPISFDKILSEPDHTTHFTIMDGEGNVVTSTQTINGWFGSSLVAAGTGIVMNNEMDDFASHVGGVNLFGAIGGKNNLVEPGKRPLSSMSPSIVYNKKGEPILALGTPSGTRILTCVMQTILNYIEHDMPLWDAVSATRIHHQWQPEEIRVGPPGFDKSVEEKLKKMGHKLNHKSLGCSIQAIARYQDQTLHGVSDPRGEGSSVGF
ncbi:MAG: gamma-glutamyltransferase [Halobacteriovoraceae bacterium]|nr:gamma-glutamyltransferase [Halobacteriovoraceae bacterium]|tara:strand:- start:20704 stop:22434 length:1731 start_codon:yes stop_codon:yes gene_type:complete